MYKKLKKIVMILVAISFLILQYISTGEKAFGDKGISYRLSMKIMHILHLPPVMYESPTIDNVNYIIRKAAHFTEFFILAVLIISILSMFTLKRWTITLITLVFCMLVAMSDEIHQIFVPGRTPQLKDIIFDFSGSAACIMLALLISAKRRKNFNYN